MTPEDAAAVITAIAESLESNPGQVVQQNVGMSFGPGTHIRAEISGQYSGETHVVGNRFSAEIKAGGLQITASAPEIATLLRELARAAEQEPESAPGLLERIRAGVGDASLILSAAQTSLTLARLLPT